MVNVQSVGLTLRPNRTNWLVFFFPSPAACHKNADSLLLSVLYCVSEIPM